MPCLLPVAIICPPVIITVPSDSLLITDCPEEDVIVPLVILILPWFSIIIRLAFFEQLIVIFSKSNTIFFVLSTIISSPVLRVIFVNTLTVVSSNVSGTAAIASWIVL